MSHVHLLGESLTQISCYNYSHWHGNAKLPVQRVTANSRYDTIEKFNDSFPSY